MVKGSGRAGERAVWIAGGLMERVGGEDQGKRQTRKNRSGAGGAVRNGMRNGQEAGAAADCVRSFEKVFPSAE